MTNTDTNLVVAAEQHGKELQKQSQEEAQYEKLAHLLTTGDISKMNRSEKDKFLVELARAQNLMPWPPPFQIIQLNGKDTIYASKSCTDQLRKIHGISLEVVYQGPLMLGDKANPDVYCVRVRATDRNGRTDEDMGAVSIANLVGEALSNATLKAITKAKRRVTLAITGLSILDETEVQSMQSAQSLSGPRVIQPSQVSFATPQELQVHVVDATVESK